MFGLFRNLAPNLKLGGYRERCEKAVTALAGACGADEQRELERFRWCHEHLDPRGGRLAPPQLGASGGDLLEQFAVITAQDMPLFFEFVLSHPGDGGPRFSYLTQGQATGSLTQSLGSLLGAVIAMHLEAQGDPSDADLLARQFRTAFPGLSTLDAFAPTAQAMLVGVVPEEQTTRLKVYFNTRMDTSTPHRERVLALLATVGLADEGLYDLLYDQTEGARFHGVGVDVARGRAKLYVHVSRDRVDETLNRLGRLLHQNGATEKRIRDPASALLTALDSDALLDQVEVAVSLRHQGDTTAKVTAFLSPKRSGGEDVERVVSYVESQQHDVAPLRATIESLRDGMEKPSRQKQPVHGVGIETPTGDRTKVNVYLQATM